MRWRKPDAASLANDDGTSAMLELLWCRERSSHVHDPDRVLETIIDALEQEDLGQRDRLPKNPVPCRRCWQCHAAVRLLILWFPRSGIRGGALKGRGLISLICSASSDR